MSLVRKRKAAASVLLMLTFNEEEETVHAKRGKTRKWIKRREEKGYFNNIVEELRVEDTASYREMMRMDYETFQDILTAITPTISKKQVQGGHKIISPAERLTLTLRYLATGIFEPAGRLRPPADRKTLMQLENGCQTRENSHRLS